jgi:hypothetical protein
VNLNQDQAVNTDDEKQRQGEWKIGGNKPQHVGTVRTP